MSTPAAISEADFIAMVDHFIGQANAFSQRYPSMRVNAAMLMATARYNAFNWVHRSQLLEQSSDEAALAFRAEYEAMFRDNVRDLQGGTKA